MKNKRLLYLLIPLTIIIWGFIVSKLLTHKKNAIAQNTISAVLTSNKESNMLSIDTFKIIAHYKDPFMSISGSYSNLDNNSTKTVTLKHPRESPKVTVQWPEIRYGGEIKNINSKKNLFLISINNQNFLVKEGDVVLGIVLARAFNDSVVIRFKNEKRTIVKNL